MSVKTTSWKQKIDPAFDKFIKLYSLFLGTIQLPGNEGYISVELSDNYLRKLETEGFPSIASMYEHDKVEDSAFDFFSMLHENFTMPEFKKIMREMKKGKNNLPDLLLWAAEQIQEKDSREYYTKKFERFRSKSDYQKYIENMDEIKLKKWKQEIYSDLQSLQVHNVLKGIEDLRENIVIKRKQVVKRFNEQPRILKRSIFGTWDTISLLVHRKGLKKLFDEARKGNDESLFKLLQIDKTLFDHEWLRVKIRKASYSGDWKFFNNLSKAIKTDPLNNRKVHGDIFLILVRLWTAGLYRLTIPQMMQLFEDSGVRMRYDEINFRKFVDREIKPLFKEW